MIQFIAQLKKALVKKAPTNKNSVIQNQKGMTLIEIMIVIAIIGSLMAIIGNRVIGQRDKANVGNAKIQMGQVANALSMYYNDCGKMPEALGNLVQPDAACSSWGPEPYRKEKEIIDPWGSPFVYELNGADYTLKSLGRDKREGGSGYDADIPYEN